MRLLNQLIIDLSRKWWTLLIVVILNFAAFGILFALEDQFEALTGIHVYDTQNELTSDLLLEQLPLYTGEARNAYMRFAAFDFVFPLVAAVFLAVLWAFLLRLNTWSFAQRLLLGNLPLFALIVTLADWLENVSLLTVINAGSTPDQAWINAVLFFKQLKLTLLTINGALTAALFLLLVLNLISRLVQSRRVTALQS